MKYEGAILYTRISRLTEESTSIVRQDEDCKREIDRRGLKLLATYSDPDKSGWNKKIVRPEFGRMMRDVDSGLYGKVLVVVWMVDRFSRQPREGEDLIDLIRDGKCGLLALRDGIDLIAGQDTFVLRLRLNLGAQESEKISMRVKSSRAHLAKQGIPSKGSRYRPFGYNADKVTTFPEEARFVEEMAERFLRGEGSFTIANALKASGAKTVADKDFTAYRVTQILRSPRVAGLVEHDGEYYGGVIQPIIPRDMWDAIQRRMNDPARKANESSNSQRLLTGVLVCGRCGCTMVSAGHNYRCYQPQNSNRGSCGTVYVRKSTVERLVEEAIFDFFSNMPVTPPDSPGDVQPLIAQRLDLVEQSRRLTGAWRQGYVIDEVFQSEIMPINRAIAETERQIEVQEKRRLTWSQAPVLGIEEEWKKAMEEGDVSRCRAIVSRWIERITVAPRSSDTQPGRFHPSRLQFAWHDAE